MSELNEFKATDRCDTCGARTSVRVILDIDGPGLLEFCSHHGRRNLQIFLAKGVVLKDVKFSEDFADAGLLFPFVEREPAAY